MEHAHVYQVKLFATENVSTQPLTPQIAVHVEIAVLQGCIASTENAHVRESERSVMEPASILISMIRIVAHAGIVVLQAHIVLMELAKKFKENIENPGITSTKLRNMDTPVRHIMPHSIKLAIRSNLFSICLAILTDIDYENYIQGLRHRHLGASRFLPKRRDKKRANRRVPDILTSPIKRYPRIRLSAVRLKSEGHQNDPTHSMRDLECIHSPAFYFDQ